MPESTILQIEIEDQTRRLTVPPDQRHITLAEVLRRHELPLNTRCGQRGLCEGCVVELVSGRLLDGARGEPVTATADQPLLVRACTLRLSAGGSVTLRIPPRSLLAHQPQVLTDFAVNIPRAHDPLFDGPLAIAVDIGTTTVVAALIDLVSGELLARAAAFNAQMHLGDDVLTRINLCLNDAAMIGRLQHAIVVETLAPLIDECLRTANRTSDELAGVVVAGNTTMLHLFVGIDPSSMGMAPFTPTFLEARTSSARDIGLDIRGAAPQLSVQLLPGGAAYIGADIVAGALASGLFYEEGPVLLVDIGTNGEIVLKYGDTLSACATAAGPAFEGSRLSCGTRAGDGAIAHIGLSTDPPGIDIEVIGRQKPLGLCGSAYIDLLGEGRHTGLLNAVGRFDWRAAPGLEPHRHRVNGHEALRVALGRGREPIYVTESDLASLLQAKAAIAAGVITLLHRLHLTPRQVHKVFLAGGFAMNLDLVNAIRCGLLPGFEPRQVQLVGNTSLAGAYLATLDRSVLLELSRLARQLHVVELNLDAQFESCYIDHLSLP